MEVHLDYQKIILPHFILFYFISVSP